MRRIAALLLVALMLAAIAAAARAQPQPYPGTHPAAAPKPRPHPLVQPAPAQASDGPSWTAAILGGVAVLLASGFAGIAAGRASVRLGVR